MSAARLRTARFGRLGFMGGSDTPAARGRVRWGAVATSILLPVAGVLLSVAVLFGAPGGERPFLLAAIAVAAAAGLSATTIGVFGGVLVPGLLLLGVDPRVAAPLSLLLQVMVIPIGATSHYTLGNVRRSITLPLIVGGVAGSTLGALFAFSVPEGLVGRLVALVIVVVGVIVLISLRTGYASVPREEVHAGRISGVGLVSGFASGISGAGWGPIGVKLLILSRIEPRHAIGSSLVGRVFMAAAAITTYVVTAWSTGGVRFDLTLLPALLGASVAAMIPGAHLVSRLGRGRASAFVAVLSIALALPTLVFGVG